MTTAVYLKNALNPAAYAPVSVPPSTIQALAPRDWDTPFVAFVDGKPVLRADWEVVLDDDQAVAFVDVHAIPQGGGGGGSNPLQMILSLAVLTFAPQLGAFLGSEALGGAVLGLSGSTWTGILTFAGLALVNMLVPPPKLPSPQQASALASPSPTYSLQAQGNIARLEAAIPEHFGRHIAYPDFAAQPYQEFSGNEQFLFQLLCIGRGSYDIEEIRVEDTPISSFSDITYEVVPPGGALTLFPANVTTSTEVAGQDLMCAAGSYVQSGTTTVQITLTGHGLAIGNTVYLDYTSGTAVDGTFTVATTPTADTFTVTAAGSLTTSGAVTVSQWVGGFIANASGTEANYLSLDFVLPRGLYHAEMSGALTNMSVTVLAEYRTVDSVGAPTSSYTTLGTYTYTAATTTPPRFSERSAVTAGRYQVRVRRTDIEQTDTTYGHDIAWAGLRAYLKDTRAFGDVTLLAMRMRASNNLSAQASRKINVIATRRLPAWNGTSWTAEAPTRSIAWALAYICKQVGLTDAQIDLAALLALDATWASRQDYFDGRYDNFLGFWEAVSKTAAAGRAKPYMQGGVMRFKRDQAATIPVAMFSMRNIVRGSFSINYLMPTVDTADAVDVRYLDSSTWSPARVRANLPSSSALKPSKVELFGVVGRDQAYREGMYQAASNRYRRRIIKFRTEMEGFIPSFGDLIAVQHDMPAWGQHSEVERVVTSKNLLAYTNDMRNTAEVGSTRPWSQFVDADVEAVLASVRNPASELGCTKVRCLTATSAQRQVSQGLSGIADNATVTASVYAKAGEVAVVGIVGTTKGGTFPLAAFNVSTGVLVNSGGTGYISSAIQNVGSGWFRISMTFNIASGGTSPGVNYQINALAGGNYSGAVGDGAFLWGAQVEVGSSATEYFPSQETFVSRGSEASYFDDDWVLRYAATNQARYYQFEGKSRLYAEAAATNLLLRSDDFANAVWQAIWAKNLVSNTATAPDGTLTADTLSDVSTSQFEGLFYTLSVANDAVTRCFSLFVKKTIGGTSKTFGINIRYAGGTGFTRTLRLNTDTGSLFTSHAGGVKSRGDWWRIWIPITNNSSGNTTLNLELYPSTSNYGGGSADIVTAMGSATIWGAQLEVASYPSSYIRTTSAQVTRAADVYTSVSSAGRTLLTMSEAFTFATGNHYLGLRKRDGSVDGPYLVQAAGANRTVSLASAPTSAPYVGLLEERTHASFGWSETWRQPALVLSAKPVGLNIVEIEAVNEDSNVHTAEVGAVTPARTYSQLANYNNAPVIEGLMARSSPADPAVMLLSWKPSPWANTYLIEQSSDGVTWTRSGEVSTANFTANVLYGTSTIIRVAAVGIAKGPWVQINYNLFSDYAWTNDSSAAWTTDSTLAWTY